MEEPVLIRDKSSMRAWSRDKRRSGATLALVPTMGYLHEGHISLVRAAAAVADVSVVSIYVNPGQFAPTEDLTTYPTDLPNDIRKLAEVGTVAAVFCPTNLYDYGPKDGDMNMRAPENAVVSCLEQDEMGHETWVRVERLEKGLCGRSRPVMFRGVATVVSKLFNIVEPDVAVFGKKDYQQWRIICRMVRDLDFPVRILGSEIVREADGLAMSSRNVHLSPEQREKALSISRSLLQAKSSVQNGQTSCILLKSSVIQKITEVGGRMDYMEIVEQESLKTAEQITGPVVICIAAWFGKVRLIDNMEINI